MLAISPWSKERLRREIVRSTVVKPFAVMVTLLIGALVSCTGVISVSTS